MDNLRIAMRKMLCYAIYLWVNKLVLHFMGQLTTGRVG